MTQPWTTRLHAPGGIWKCEVRTGLFYVHVTLTVAMIPLAACDRSDRLETLSIPGDTLATVLPSVVAAVDSLHEEPAGTLSSGNEYGGSDAGALAVVDRALPVDEDWRVGGPNASRPAAFGTLPLLLSASPNGQIVVLDGATQEIRVFGADGGFVREFGNRGRGPGEFEFASAMGWDSLDRLWILDNARYTVLDTLGNVIRTVLRPRPGLSSSASLMFDRTGAIVEPRPMRPSDARFVGPSILVDAYSGTAGIGFVRIDTMGSVIDTLPPIQGPDFDLRNRSRGAPVLRESNAHTSGTLAERGLAALAPFVPDVVYTLTPEGIWYAYTNSNVLTYRGHAGDIRKSIRMLRRSASLSRAEDSLINERLTIAGRQRKDWAYGRQVLRGIYPLNDGRVMTLIEERAGEPSNLLDVYDAAGTFIGSFRLGASINPTSAVSIRGDTLVATTIDELGVKYVFQVTIPEVHSVIDVSQ